MLSLIFFRGRRFRIVVKLQLGFLEAVDPCLLHGTENTVAQPLMLMIQIGKKLLHGFSLRIAVRGTSALDHGQFRVDREIADVLLGGVDQRSDDRDIRSVKIGYRREAAESSLKEKIQHKGFYHVIKVMTQSDLIASKLLGGIVKHSAAELGAKRAGVGFLTHVENDLGDIGRLHVIGYVQFFAKLADGCVIRRNAAALQITEPHIHRNRHKLKRNGIEATKLCHRIKQGKRILSRRHADGDFIARLDHRIIVARTSRIAENPFQTLHPFSSPFQRTVLYIITNLNPFFNIKILFFSFVHANFSVAKASPYGAKRSANANTVGRKKVADCRLHKKRRNSAILFSQRQFLLIEVIFMFYNKVELCGVNTSKLKTLTDEEKNELLHLTKSGNKKAREELIAGNLRLVLSIIQRFGSKAGDADDLFQVGCIGLIKAIDNFDTEIGVKFSTYAVPMIIGEIRRYLRDNNMLRVSRGMRDLAYRALNERELLASKMDTEPSINEIAEALGEPVRLVSEALEAIMAPISLYDPVYGENGDSLYVMDQICDEQDNVEAWLENIAIAEAMKKLTDRERAIVSMRFYRGKTQMEIADEIGISQAQVSRIEKSALERIRKEM